MPGVYRVIYQTTSEFRLAVNAADDPAAWRVEIGPGGAQGVVTVRDLVESSNDIPSHRGIAIDVEIPEDSIDSAVVAAGKIAETIFTFLTAAARTPGAPLLPILAYDATPDLEERPLIQWLDMPEMTGGKTPVPGTAFGFLYQGMAESTDEKLVARIRLSMEWHRTALTETEPLFRFIRLWFACEALQKRLAEHYSVDAHGFQGLRRLAEDEGFQADYISSMLRLRKNLVHNFSERPQDLRPEAAELVPIMERLLIAGWSRLLGSPGMTSEFPTTAFTPHPMRYEIHGIIFQADVSAWQVGHHPHYSIELASSRVPSADPGKVSVTYKTVMRLQNADAGQITESRIWGPSGPNLVSVDAFSISNDTLTDPSPAERNH